MKTKKLNKKIQKREVIIKEYEDKTYELIGSAWNLDNLNSEEIDDAYLHWKNGNLENNKKTKIPKMIRDNSN
jgi:hypothetical protein